MSSIGDGRDTFHYSWGPQSLSPINCISIQTLLHQHPELEDVAFVKMDVEGHEKVLVSALADFFKRKRPVVLVSLHPDVIGGYAGTRALVEAMHSIFPFL